ncbi:MAG TPA: signal peptide peptidase SppA [Xanthobacteraceae bacterium]|jgi:protease-4|nr:signal peptide peptidase SppA [Xanthobacteraceae bacterium]
MSLDADFIVDRRRLRRKLTFWRVLTVLVVILAVAGISAAGRSRFGFGGVRPYIARVTISGLIRGDRERVEQLDRLSKTAQVRAVIVHVDSPGGTTAGSEQLYDSLSQLREKKPLVIVVDSLAASGGYITALAGDHIVAQQTSLVGSIGVLFQFPNVSELLDKIGVKMEAVKSTPLKAAPDGYEPTSPEARAALNSIIQDSYAWFKGLVQSRRHMTDGELQTAADGRVFTGHQAIDLKLIDELGDEHNALDWLAKEKNVDAKLPVRDYALQSRLGDLTFLHAAARATLDAVGLTGLADQFGTSGAVEAVQRLNLDGLLALWHPASAN